MERPAIKCRDCGETQVVPPEPNMLPQDPAELAKRAWSGWVDCINCGSRNVDVKVIEVKRPT